MERYTIVKRHDENSARLATTIQKEMQARAWIYDETDPELIICVGGDGTLLNAFHLWSHKLESVAFVGIHTGTLGFFTDYTEDTLDNFFNDLKNPPIIESKRVLEAEFVKGDVVQTVLALNEIRVENIIRTQKIVVSLNYELFETFRGNGLCISGQYGSTAYNRSIGGAVIYPGLDLLQITEISGVHHRYAQSLNAPLILAPSTEITLTSDSFADALLCYDNLHLHLDDVEQIRISSYQTTMKLIHFNHISHIERLNALF